MKLVISEIPHIYFFTHQNSRTLQISVSVLSVFHTLKKVWFFLHNCRKMNCSTVVVGLTGSRAWMLVLASAMVARNTRLRCSFVWQLKRLILLNCIKTKARQCQCEQVVYYHSITIRSIKLVSSINRWSSNKYYRLLQIMAFSNTLHCLKIWTSQVFATDGLVLIL